jgi:hypothetical protein
MNLNSLLQSPDASQRTVVKAHISKWERTGLLEGLKSETEKAGMATLLENQARQLVKESSATGTAAGSEEWAGVALPLVRRIFAEFAAKEFVSVQPMNLPSGLVFYLDFKYGTAQPGFDDDNAEGSGHPFGSPEADDSMFGVTNTSGDPSGGLYGAGRFGYSIPDVSVALAATAATTGSAGGPNAPTSASLNFDSLYTANSTQYMALTVNVPTNADKLAVRSFTLASGSGNTEIIPVQAFTTIDANFTASFVVTASLANAIQLAITAGNLDLKYSKQPTDITRGDFEDANPFKGSGANTGINNGTDLDIPEVNLELQSEPIVAKTRKLKAVWTPEFAQDLNAYHSIDAEAELTSMLSEYVSMEIDLEILDMLISSAPTTEYWSAVNNEFWNGTSFDSAAAVGAGGFYNTQGGWFQTLGTKLQKVSNKIHQKTLRGGANFLVTSPAVATILESIPGFAADTDGNKMEFAAGVQKIGAINNRYTVYKNPYMKENVILMGFRGAQFLETGAVFSPYVPLIMTPLVYDPVNFTPRKGVMTRYAKKVVRPEFYGKVYVKGLETI